MWAVKYATVREEPGDGTKVLDVPTHGIVELLGEQREISYGGNPTVWVKISYRDFTGWVYREHLEEYQALYPHNEVEIADQTPKPDDLEQYFYYEGDVKYNMCGQLCVAWILGIPVKEILDSWKVGSHSFYERIFMGANDKGTTDYDLNNLLSLYEFETPCVTFKNGLLDPVAGRELVTPRRMDKMLETHHLIASVSISRVDGNLREPSSKTALHWVVVNQVVADGVDRGFVELYNPAPNRMQLYSWNEFITSAGSPYGLWVLRRSPRVITPIF